MRDLPYRQSKTENANLLTARALQHFRSVCSVAADVTVRERHRERERERETEKVKVKVKDHGHILNTIDLVQLSMSGDFSVQYVRYCTFCGKILLMDSVQDFKDNRRCGCWG